MKLTRSRDPGPFSRYGDYKPHLQPLFSRRCAFCVMHEDSMGGYDAMEVDHFRPHGRSEFAHLKREWTNLYYSCRLCNGRKSNHWPTKEQKANGLRFVDPCAEDPDDHIRLDRHQKHGDLSWLHGRTPAGRYTIDRIHLNRKQLVDKRRELARNEQEEQERLSRNKEAIGLLSRDVATRGASHKIQEVLRSLESDGKRIVRKLKERQALRPFQVR